MQVMVKLSAIIRFYRRGSQKRCFNVLYRNYQNQNPTTETSKLKYDLISSNTVQSTLPVKINHVSWIFVEADKKLVQELEQVLRT